MFKSDLFDEETFYQAFLVDLENSQGEVIIESPFITTERMTTLWPMFNKLLKRRVKIYVMTRDPKEHMPKYMNQSEHVIQKFEEIGIQSLICTGRHHRKLAIIDREILWEGSLNILSQSKSKEFMRRLEGGGFAVDLFNFIGYDRFL
jgi:phosphatidylserine/phosphatidylglycerophosphate/cardiolipin synthase-like enzyme